MQITQLAGYRNSVLIWLKQLRVLDGTEVRDADREAAQDAYLNQVSELATETLARPCCEPSHTMQQGPASTPSTRSRFAFR